MIAVLVQDEMSHVTESVPGSRLEQAFHPAVRSLMRKDAESAPEVVFPVPKPQPVISTVWAARAPNGPTELSFRVQGAAEFHGAAMTRPAVAAAAAPPMARIARRCLRWARCFRCRRWRDCLACPRWDDPLACAGCAGWDDALACAGWGRPRW